MNNLDSKKFKFFPLLPSTNQTMPRKKLPARSTRGKRIREISKEEAEADEHFWNQAAWKEMSDDESVNSSEGDVGSSSSSENDSSSQQSEDSAVKNIRRARGGVRTRSMKSKIEDDNDDDDEEEKEDSKNSEEEEEDDE